MAQVTKVGFILLLLAAVTVTITAPSLAANASPDSLTLAVVRTDGFLIPIAQHSDGKFKGFWPDYHEQSKMGVMNFDELPAGWFSKRMPASDKWFYTSFEGNKKTITSKVKSNHLRCDTVWGVDTDLEKKPYECRNCCPYPKVGIATDKDVNFTAVEKVASFEPFTEHFRSLYGDDAISRLHKALRMQKELAGKAAPSVEERVLLEPNNVKIFKISSRKTTYFFEIILVSDLENYDKNSPAFDVHQGWLREDAGKLRTITAKTVRTDCDFQIPDFLTPHNSFMLNGKEYVIVEESGYEWETWSVYEIGDSGVRVVASAMTHAL